MARTLSAVLALFALYIHIASAYSIRGFLDSGISNGPPLVFSPSTEITLRSADTFKKTYVMNDGEAFLFSNVTEGSYVLSVHSIEHVFPVFRIDVLDGGVEVFLTHKGSEWDVKGNRQPYPIELKPLGSAIYYQNREGFNIFKLFKNPMLIVALLTLIMVVVVPKIASSIDPEELKEMQSQAVSMPSVSNAMNFDVAGYLAGKASGSSSTEPSAKGNSRNRKH
ncbi:hypothetical protein V1512DRAFT_228293 [Lipomyces arxii]|uniref:uncharacterized protein n=1 Tax=Lipomyces arxii TaxID=56418 RepID=UPI0034CE98D5